MVYKLEQPIKLISLLAPFVFFLFPSGPINSESPLAFLIFAFPYFIVLAFTQFVKRKSPTLLIATATLLALLVLSSVAMISGTTSDPQSSIGVFFVYIVQALAALLFVSVYSVIRAFKGSVHNKPL